MSLIAVEAAITVADPGDRQDLIDVGTDPAGTRDDEPGCIVYCFAADPCRDDLIEVYELWESEEAPHGPLRTSELHRDAHDVQRRRAHRCREPQAPHRRVAPRCTAPTGRRPPCSSDIRNGPVPQELSKWLIMGG